MIKKYFILNEGDDGFLIYDYETERWKASRYSVEWVIIEAEDSLIKEYQKVKKDYELAFRDVSNCEVQLSNLYEAFKDRKSED